MKKESILTFTKALFIVGGISCFIYALLNISIRALSWDFLFVLIFTVFIASRLSLALPRSKFIVTFSDALIFLTFLIYGGEAAILLASFETLANCIFIKSKGINFGYLMIPTNISIITISTTITYFVWSSTSFYNAEISAHTPHL
nr:hypothetical protein [Acidobacteriota bacterium]